MKVFISGRNRLENEGAKALSEAFKILGSLEEITMPQNGIRPEGVVLLAEAFKQNKNLKVNFDFWIVFIYNNAWLLWPIVLS